MISAYLYTVLIKNSSLRKGKVPRDILELEFSSFDSKGLNSSVGSPRIKKDGTVFYLATEGVAIAWMDTFNDWANEIRYLESFELKRIYDFMPLLPLGMEDAEELLEIEQEALKECAWLKFVPFNHDKDSFHLSRDFVVNPCELDAESVGVMGFSR